MLRITQIYKLRGLRPIPIADLRVSLSQESGLSCILCSGSRGRSQGLIPCQAPLAVGSVQFPWAAKLRALSLAVSWRLPPAPCQVGPSRWQLVSPKPARGRAWERGGSYSRAQPQGSDTWSSCLLCSVGYMPVLGPTPQEEGTAQWCEHQDAENHRAASQAVDREEESSFKNLRQVSRKASAGSVSCGR